MASVLNAHYTSKEVIDGIYKGLSRFGVKGNNRILEPALGTGNFFGYMPKEILAGAKLYGVELDRLTGKIATKLYPEAKIQIKGFEATSFPDEQEYKQEIHLYNLLFYIHILKPHTSLYFYLIGLLWLHHS